MYHYETNTQWKPGIRIRLGSPGLQTLQIEPPTDFGGAEGYWTPEHLLTGAVESCLLLTLRHFMNQEKLDLVEYRSQAHATMDRTPDGLRMQEIQITMVADVRDETEAATFRACVEKTEKACPVSNAVNVPVRVLVETHVVQQAA